MAFITSSSVAKTTRLTKVQKPLKSRNNSPLVELSQKNSDKSRVNESNKRNRSRSFSYSRFRTLMFFP